MTFRPGRAHAGVRCYRARVQNVPAAVSSSRYDRIDALRGVAIVWMALFHFAFDLSHFRFTQQDFYRDPFWTARNAKPWALGA